MFEKKIKTDPGSISLSGESVELRELINKGDVLVVQAKLPEALASFTAALAIVERPPLKGSATHQAILKRVGDLMCVTGDYAEAERHLFQYLVRESTSLDSARVRFTLAQVSFAVRKFEQAISLLEPTIKLAREATGLEYDPILVAHSLWLQAMAYRECSRIDDAAESCLEALEILEDVYGPDSRQALLCQCTLDNVSIMRGDLADAAANLPRVLKSLRAQLHETDLDLGTALVANARLTFAFARAIRNMRIDCVDRREPHDKESVIEVLTSYGLKGSAADVSRQYGDWIPNKELKAFTARLERRLLKRSKAFLEEALNISRHGLGENHPSNAELLEQLSVVCEVLNQDEESARYESEAANLRKLNRARTDF